MGLFVIDSVMLIDLDDLPSDPALLQRLVREMAGAVESRDGEIERLQSIIKKLRRTQFGRRSERLDPDQLALALEDLDADIARIRESRPSVERQPSERPSHRKPLPDHLPRKDVLLDIGGAVCGCCGGALHSIGESVSEILDWVPAQLRVIRTTRPKYACRTCETVVQAPAPERLIASGLATPALLAQVLVSKYCDHTPLYRQSRIFARHSVDLARSTLAGWIGGACWWLEALHERLARNVFASDHLFADDTPVPVLDPGRGASRPGGQRRGCRLLDLTGGVDGVAGHGAKQALRLTHALGFEFQCAVQSSELCERLFRLQECCAETVAVRSSIGLAERYSFPKSAKYPLWN